MEGLNEREVTVLKLIMESYIASAEPVGSRFIAHTIKNKLSPATIRNIMASLEEKGYLYKPHVVAGRIPTHKAFRHYVNNLLLEKSPFGNELQIIEALLKPHYSYVEEIMEDASRALAILSQFTSIVVEPKINSMLFKEVEFVKLSKHTILVLFVTSSGIVHTRLVNTDENLDENLLVEMKTYMNEKFGGIPFCALKEGIIEDLKKDKELYNKLLEKIQEALENIMEEGYQREIYMEGASTMIGVPEFSDIRKLKELFNALEKKEKLLRLLDSFLEEEGISVVIGNEINLQEMHDMSIIASPYKISETGYGIIGVIGPIRMDYSRIIPLVDYTANKVTTILNTM